MPERINLDEQLNTGRAPIDAKWSVKTKRIVIAVSVLVAVGAISGGLWAASEFSTPGLPNTAEEALAIMGSAKFDRMNSERKSAYAEQAANLLRDLPQDERRAMFRDEEQRDAMRALMQQRMGDIARAVARGETPDFSSFRGGPPRDRAQREEMTDEERAERLEQMRTRMREQMNAQFQSGNAQSGALMGEMFKNGGGMRGRRGGGGRGRG